MSAERNEDLLEQIMELARQYGLRKWGQVPKYLKFTLHDDREQVEIVPQGPVVPRPAAEAPAVAAAPAPAVGTAWHNTDFTIVRWPGLGEFHFGEKQAAVVAELWAARFEDEDDPYRDQEALLKVADSECTKLSELFKRNPAWGTLILHGAGAGAGSYRLP